MKYAYLIIKGNSNTEIEIDCVFLTKKDAEEYCKEKNKKFERFSNYDISRIYFKEVPLYDKLYL